MKKIIMVDGNNLIFRSYYATAYSGNLMKNSKGFPTNALYGFVSMINKIITEEKPVYMIVAFDKGKTFRHEFYEAYKAGRIETPDDLKKQFPLVKEILTHLGIKYYEIDDYEADDIIGTVSKFCDDDSDYIGTIVSSDKDLLQLISTDVDIKLLKQKDYIRYDLENFKEEFGIEPINVIDLKALQGDPSDNIPGVRGIGEKTALKLLQEYQTIDNVYENIDQIKGKLQEKLVEGKEDAYLSKKLATIVKDVPLDFEIDELLIKKSNEKELRKIYEDLEFYSLLKKLDKTEIETENIEINIINSVDEIKIKDKCSIYLEILGNNYHKTEILGLSVWSENQYFFVMPSLIKDVLEKLKDVEIYTYDYKKIFVALKWLNIKFEDVTFDSMIAAYLLDYNVKEDIAYLANQFGYEIDFYESVFGKSKLQVPELDILAKNAILKAKFIYETADSLKTALENEEMLSLYYDIDLPLAKVLGKMEYEGINVDTKILEDMGEEIKVKIEYISNEIYNMAGEEFNISSPNQLGVILFEKLGLKHGKKNARGYSTAVDVLNKLKGKHPIIELILEYRLLTKLYTTYIEGLINATMSDNKIHTIYNQALTRTGRLSSIEPNLQNIPIRYEYGRLIRKAFIPSEKSVLVSSDYSQIELRILAHVSNVDSLIEAFNKKQDIHTKTAIDIFKVPEEYVTGDMRRVAKAVNFGIIYGISSFGLSENLDIEVKEAKEFIDNYLETYPGVKKYMDDTISKAHADKFVKTLFNRKRTIMELDNRNYMIRQQGERMALNTPIQGTSADIIKKAMIEIDQEFEKNNLQSKMLLQVHDELVFDVLEKEKEIVINIIREIMENTYKLSVPLSVEVTTGDNWYQAK